MAAQAWALTGNAGTNPSADSVGTTDNEPLVIKTNGQERVRIDTNGNVGIGTTTPNYPLHMPVGKTLRIEGGTNAADAGNYFSFGGNGTFGIDAPGVLNGRLVVQNSGNVGIGTAAPASTLHVNGVVTLSPQSSIVLGTGAFGSVVGSTVGEGPGRPSELVFYTTPPGEIYTFPSEKPKLPIPVEALRIDSRGYVGIGTTAPQSALQIKTLTAVSEGATAAGAWANIGSNSYYDGAWKRVDPAKAGVNLHMNAADGAGQEFRFHRIEADGTNERNIAVLGSGTSFILASKVGIGTASPSHQLEVVDASSNTGLRVQTNTAGGTVASFGGFGDFQIDADEVVGGRLIVKESGNVGIGTNAPTSRLHVAGDVAVTGDVLLTGADCAEHFDVSGARPEPGAVVVIGEDGVLQESQKAYDKKVAGVVSGAGEYRHGLVLDKRPSEEGRIPVALVGKVYCKVDARYSPVEVGDLLTTSQTPGHAMKATDAAMAFGAVIGKALKPLNAGRGLIPILISLQ